MREEAVSFFDAIKNKKTAGFDMPTAFRSFLLVSSIRVHPRQMGTTKDNT